MSTIKLDNYTLQDWEQALNDYWFAGDYVTLPSGNRVTQTELEQAQSDFWNNSPGTVQLIETSSEKARAFFRALDDLIASGELPVAQVLRMMIDKIYNPPAGNAITISDTGGFMKVTLEALGYAATQKLEFTPPADGHFTEAEFNQAMENFWKP